MPRDFGELLARNQEIGKCVCIGLDSDAAKIPGPAAPQHVVTFNKRIIFETHNIVGAYKPNLAFYEARGSEGLDNLRSTISYINQVAPHVPVIGDGKRADIGNTNDGYVSFLFDWLGVDAVTLSPYLGGEALAPFLKRKDKGVFILCRTSNPGAGEFQDLICDDKPLYQHVAQHVADGWNTRRNCGLVVGATYPDELRQVRKIVGDMPILIPGIGAQGGDLEATIKAGKGKTSPAMLINSSRGIIFASEGKDFAEAARRETEKLHQAITACLSKGAV